MTLLNTILKKVRSQESVAKKYPSPPPEINKYLIKPKKKKRARKRRERYYTSVCSSVDSSPPCLHPMYMRWQLAQWARQATRLYTENIELVMKIRRQFLLGGRVDNHWHHRLPVSRQYYQNRVNFLKLIQKENSYLYKRIKNVTSQVLTTKSHQQDWMRNRQEIVNKAHCKFVLFPPIPQEDIEDSAFVPPAGVKRPRVYLTLRIKGGATIGELGVELFSDVCPLTCQLFTELLAGDSVGYSYVGTCFFRKVPNLYWCGGDVVHNNGFGCYAQKGRRRPIGAENFHFSHSMQGLLSMRVTPDDEICSSFNITFKPLTQFDLQNIVFARVIRPCNTYNSIREIGLAFSSQPTVEVVATRIHVGRRWLSGLPNTNLTSSRNTRMQYREKNISH